MLQMNKASKYTSRGSVNEGKQASNLSTRFPYFIEVSSSANRISSSKAVVNQEAGERAQRWTFLKRYSSDRGFISICFIFDFTRKRQLE